MQLERRLTNAWTIRINDVAEGPIVEVAVYGRRSEELRVMECIESLKAEFSDTITAWVQGSLVRVVAIPRFPPPDPVTPK